MWCKVKLDFLLERSSTTSCSACLTEVGLQPTTHRHATEPRRSHSLEGLPLNCSCSTFYINSWSLTAEQRLRTDLIYDVSVHYSDQKATPPFLSPLAFHFPSPRISGEHSQGRWRWNDGQIPPHEYYRNDGWDSSHEIIQWTFTTLCFYF